MIDKNTVFELLGGRVALWCGTDMDSVELARAAQFATDKGVSVVSVAPNAVQTIWPWMENSAVKIMTRFYLDTKNITEKHISDVTVRINAALRQGAHGAQIFLPCVALPGLVEQTHVVRDDLFFNKDLSIGMDISDVGPFDWGTVFDNLRKINASSVIMAFADDAGNKSDFVGRIYAMLNAWGSGNKFNLHFAFGPNFMRIEQALRLVQYMRPDLVGNMRFWVSF